MVVSLGVTWLDLVAGFIGCPFTFAIFIFGPWLFWATLRVGQRALELFDPEWAYGAPGGPRTSGAGDVGKRVPRAPSEPPTAPKTAREGL